MAIFYGEISDSGNEHLPLNIYTIYLFPDREFGINFNTKMFYYFPDFHIYLLIMLSSMDCTFIIK